MSLVTAHLSYMSCVFCIASERGHDDECGWDAENDNANDLHRYIQFSKVEGEGSSATPHGELHGKLLRRFVETRLSFPTLVASALCCPCAMPVSPILRASNCTSLLATN